MLDDYIHSLHVLKEAKRISDASLQLYLRHLESKNYSLNTIKMYLGAVIHFAFWQYRRDKVPDSPIFDDIHKFLTNHLPRCHCQRSFPRCKNSAKAALALWVEVLGLKLLVTKRSSKQEQLVHEFDLFLSEIAGLSSATRLYRCRYAFEFLEWLETNSGIQINMLVASDVADYISQRAITISSATAAVISCSISSFLRFLSSKRYCSIDPFICVPHPKAINTISSLTALKPDELDKLLNAIDCNYAVGKRDYAMARCLSDLGLRTSEVAYLKLDNLDWQKGEMLLCPGKSRRCRRLPMPDTLIDALIDYLRNARPSTNERAIFVYHRAPLGEAVSPSTVRGVMRRAFVRAGFSASESQVHRLRHTMATSLLHSGNSLKTIADLLGHQCLDTTTRYTHVDRPALLKVALPWPTEVLL